MDQLNCSDIRFRSVFSDLFHAEGAEAPARKRKTMFLPESRNCIFHDNRIFVNAYPRSLIILLIFTAAKPATCMSSYSLLALGDSYTIGESVSPNENFPNQTVQLLKKDGFDFDAPEILAKTGWTTDELQEAIDHHQFKQGYDFVTLLIGVNNQYRGRSVESYRSEFERLLLQVVKFTGDRADHVIVLSIPDWGVTPFAKQSDRQKIAREIDDYNAVNKQISLAHHVHYINITPGTREAALDNSWLAADGLHPSAKEYGRWAAMIIAIMKERL